MNTADTASPLDRLDSGAPARRLSPATIAGWLTAEPRVARDLGLLGARFMLGAVFVFHGSGKLFGAFGGPGISGFAGYLESLGFPLPTLNAYMAGGAELIGGLAIILGLLTRPLLLPLIGTMVVAAGTKFPAFSSLNNGMEYPLTLGVLLIALLLIGPGRASLDHVIASALKRRGA